MTWNEFLARVQAAWPQVGWMDVLPALLAGALTIIVIKVSLRLLVQRLRKLSARTHTAADDGFVSVLERTNGGLIWIIGLLVGLNMLPLDDRWHGRVSQLWFAVVALQIGLWGQQAVTQVLAAQQLRHGGGPALSASATLLSWGLRGALWVIVVLAVLSNLGVNITAFVASLGIGGIAVALAVQNILGDLFASLAIAVDKPFEVGDSVTVGNVTGTVERVGLKTTRIRALGGEQIVMSNAELLKQTVANFKRLQTRRVAFVFGITYDTPADEVAALPQLVKEIIQADPQLEFARAHFKGFGDSSLDFEVVYRVKDADYDLYMDRQQALNLALLRALQQRGIEFAFPTRTVNIAGGLPPVTVQRGDAEPVPAAG
ncbi:MULTISPECIES: mechanosensitive ion channel family protein [unclassified Roseateles]|uniref:mechanosensitive ion channel family protein n=1 Tax=unclassified Roseateles TaxID=2626991 RepID=UPI0007015B33|nr:MULTISPECIES: mechanosensitive ion channel family protein [unclassified Roseateles]KQW46577.1 mechanosensitive ion channel protein MscS [Pelomonas sp. Root405]KRA73628.1 mechanosensitive ion channel protein MscS [Pelomonas sp. Root662]